MKKILLAFTASLLFIGCGNGNVNEKENKEKALQEAITAAQNANITEKEIFLGFRFGMTLEEVRNHLDKLEETGKVYVDDQRNYVYDFHTELTTLRTSFVPLFHNDSLYKFNFYFTTENTLIDSAELNMLQAVKTFSQTDRTGFDFFIYEDVMGDTEYFYIKNNLIIHFDAIARARMSYINAPIDKVVEDAEKTEQTENKQSTISDF